MAFQSFEDLLVWQRSKAMAVDVYRLMRECHDVSLRDQIQRAAVSVASNIAEGYERTPKEFARFLSIAIGSCSELRTQLYIAAELKFIDTEHAEQMIDETRQLNRMMRALAKAQSNKSQQIRESIERYNAESTTPNLNSEP